MSVELVEMISVFQAVPTSTGSVGGLFRQSPSYLSNNGVGVNRIQDLQLSSISGLILGFVTK
jgi:hypothetical protein